MACARRRGRLAEAGVEDAGRDARLLVAAAAGVDTQEIIIRPERPLAADAAVAVAGHAGAALRPRARLAHPRRAGILRAPLCPLAGDARPARRFRNADRGGARPCRARRMARAAAAHPRHRHGDRLPAADAARRAAVGDRGRHRHQRRGAWTRRLRMPPRSALRHAPPSRRPTFSTASTAPLISSSAIRPTSRPARSPDLSRKCANTIRWRRSTAVRTVLPSTAGSSPSCRACYAGWVVFEVGAGQADAVAQLLQQAFVKTRHAEVARHNDLGGHTRCVAFRLQL